MDNKQALVLWSVEDGVGHIVLNRPDAANAIKTALTKAFGDVIAQAASADVGAILRPRRASSSAPAATSTSSSRGPPISTG